MNQQVPYLKQSELFISFLSPHDIDYLASFLENAYEHFRQYQSSCESSFLNDIQIIADCYSLIIMNSENHMKQDERLNIFHCYSDFKQYPSSVKKLAFAIAEMINCIADKVRLISYPWFYCHFVNAVENILSNKITYLNHKLHFAQCLRQKIVNRHCLNKGVGL